MPLKKANYIYRYNLFNLLWIVSLFQTLGVAVLSLASLKLSLDPNQQRVMGICLGRVSWGRRKGSRYKWTTENFFTLTTIDRKVLTIFKICFTVLIAFQTQFRTTQGLFQNDIIRKIGRLWRRGSTRIINEHTSPPLFRLIMVRDRVLQILY